MAHHKSAKKRIKTSEKRRKRNKVYVSRMKSTVKKVKASNSKESALEELNQAYSVIDKLVSKGIISKNTAANKKSRLTKYVSKLG
jgi:small subunit ribosomal protein S20